MNKPILECTGCGTVTRDRAAQMALYKRAGALSCCPERNLVPIANQLPPDCLPVPRWACELLLSTEPSPQRINAETAVSELLRGVVPTEAADHDAPRQARLLLAEVARLQALLDGIDSEGGSCD